MVPMWSRIELPLFKVVAFLEGASWLGLLIGMYVKYLTDAGELGVRIFGPIHGGVFVTYVVLVLLIARSHRWSLGTTLLGLASSIPPFATVVFELWAQRSGRLGRDGRSSRPDALLADARA
jgi:integral membrane protein